MAQFSSICQGSFPKSIPASRNEESEQETRSDRTQKNGQHNSSVSLAICALLLSNGLFGNKLVPPPICSSRWPPATSASVLSCLQDVIQLHLLPYPFVPLSK